MDSQRNIESSFLWFLFELFVMYYMHRVLFSFSVVLYCFSSILFFINWGLHLFLCFQRSDSTDQIYQETNSVLCVILACRIPKNTIRKTKIGLPQKESLVSGLRFPSIFQGFGKRTRLFHSHLLKTAQDNRRTTQRIDGWLISGRSGSQWGMQGDLLRLGMTGPPPKRSQKHLVELFFLYSFIMFYADLFCFLDVFFL